MKNDLNNKQELDLEYEVLMGLIREKMQIIYRNIDENNIKPCYNDNDYKDVYHLLNDTFSNLSNKNKLKLLIDVFKNQY